MRRVSGGAVIILAGFLPLLMGACRQEASQEWRQAAEDAARKRATARAEASFDSAAYDTIGWESSYARGERGSVVYEASCATCHGADGTGAGPYARGHDLEVRSIVEPDWMYRGDVPAIRRQIFVGHGIGMPPWGLTELTPRDVDAVAYYLDTRLPQRTGGP
jgi:mono/diheme cytochrome c family protein